MKIEEGKFYKTRDGKTVGPMEVDGTGQWFHYEGSEGGFRLDGKSFVGMEPDLIAPAYVEQGTLNELNLKPGDVLEFVMAGENETGYHYPKGLTVEVEEDGTVYGCSPKCCDATWRVVSRKSGGPVRTVVTRRVPNECVIGHVEVTKHGKVWMRHVTTADELRAAAETLIQIADALDNA